MVKEKKHNPIHVNQHRKRKGSELKGIKKYENAKKLIAILFYFVELKYIFCYASKYLNNNFNFLMTGNKG